MFKQCNFALVTVIWLLLFANPVFSQGNWEQILPPGPTTNQMVSVHFTDENTGLSVGEQGTILKTTDGGDSWRIIEIPWLAYLLDIYFSSPTVGYVVGQEGCILKTTDGGETWSLQETRFTNNLHRVRFRDDQNGWIIGEKALILHTDDGGAAWQQQITGTPEDLKGLAIIDDSSLCVVGTNETLLLTTDNGNNWQPIVSGGLDPNVQYNFNDVYFLDDSLGWISGEEEDESPDGILLAAKNSGQTWSKIKVEGIQLLGFQGPYFAPYFERGVDQIYFRDEQNGVCITGIYRFNWFPRWNWPIYTTDGGKNWNGESLASEEAYDQPSRLFPITETKLILTGFRGEFRFSFDGGHEWQFPNQDCRNIWDIFFGNHGKILARQILYVRENKFAVTFTWTRSEDYGQTWTEFTPQAIDSAGNTIEFTDFQTPQTSFQNQRDRLWALYFPPDAEYGQIYRSDDCGLNWYWQKGSINKALENAVFLTPDTLFRYSLVQDGESSDSKSVLEIVYSHDRGNTVQSLTFPNLWNDIQPLTNTYFPDLERFISKHYFFNGRTGFLIGSEGNIIKTEDTGQSWKSINSGVADDLWDITFIDRSTGFVGGSFGRILKTEDGGETWRKTNSGTQEHVFAIAFKNKLEGWAGTESGLRYTNDGGETWQGIPMRYQQRLVSDLCFDDDGNGYAFTTFKHQFRYYSDGGGLPASYNALLVWKNGGVQVKDNPSVLSVPERFTLDQNYPNPFNASTKIIYHLARTSMIELTIYNLQGQMVRQLEAGKKIAGKYTAVWNGLSEQGAQVASGVYIYRLECDGQGKSRKMLLLQ